MRAVWEWLLLAFHGEKGDLLAKRPAKVLVMLSVPTIVTGLVSHALTLSDMYFIGELGPQALAIVGFSSTATGLLQIVTGGLSVAIMICVAQSVGSKDEDHTAINVGQGILLSAAMGLLTAALGVVLAKWLLEVVGASPQLADAGAGYARIAMGSMVINLPVAAAAVSLRGSGAIALVSKVSMSIILVNIVLDPLLIHGYGPFPRLGVEGAAIGSVLALVGGGLTYMSFGLRGKTVLAIPLSAFRPKRAVLGRIVRLASGSMGESAVVNITWVVLMSRVALFGEEAVAAYYVALRVLFAVMLLGSGLQSATAVYVGQATGARLLGRARTVIMLSVKVSVALNTLLAIGGFFFGEDVIELFGQSAAVEHGATCLRYLLVFNIVGSIGFLACAILNGLALTHIPAVASLVSFAGVAGPLAYLLSGTELGLEGIWLAMGLGDTTLLVIAGWYLLRRRWVDNPAIESKG